MVMIVVSTIAGTELLIVIDGGRRMLNKRHSHSVFGMLHRGWPFVK